MKTKIFTILTLAFFTVFAQPQKISYQAIIRDAGGNILQNQNVLIQLDILQGSATGTTVYSEQHDVTTNQYGLVNLFIGTGSVISGSMENIDWANGPYFLKTSIDIGNGLQELGTQEIVSVPYSLYSKKADTANVAYTAVALSGPYDDSNTNELQILEIHGDTLFISNGNYVLLPQDADTDPTNEIQTLSISNDTLYLSNGNSVYLNSLAAAGSNGNIQFNNNGQLDASPSLYWDITKERLGIGTNTPQGRVVIQQDPAAPDSLPLFEVKDKDGNPVFVVYPDSVHVFIPLDSSKSVGHVGGFAVSGRVSTKGTTRPYLYVTPDSTRIYFEEDNAKSVGHVGGFAVSGRVSTKAGEDNQYFNISPNDTAIVVNDEPRVMWYPNKNAFWAGQLIINSPYDVGTNSLAVGYHPDATGEYSQALGYNPNAQGNYSTAIGNNATSMGPSSFALGENAYADDSASYAIGLGARATGFKSFAIGSAGADAYNNNIISYTTASGPYSFAIGNGSQATGPSSFAIGVLDTSTGYYSMAFGYGTNASGFYSTTLGYKTKASGSSALAIGSMTKAEGDGSFAAGYASQALASNSFVLGYQSSAENLFSFALGFMDTTRGWGSMAIGYQTLTTGSSSFAAGSSTIASGQTSTAMGSQTEASGTVSFAIGSRTKATGDYTLATGYLTEASGERSAAFGSISEAKGYASVATGNYTKAIGNNTFVTGVYTAAKAFSCAVVGYRNDTSFVTSSTSWVTTDPIFVVANGYSYPHNALTVLKNGNVGINTNTPDKLLTVDGDARITGDIYYGAIGGTDTYNKPDFVFTPDYDKDFSISYIEKFIKKHGHLPWVTAAKDEKNGINLTRMSFETLESVENLQLQIIELNKVNLRLKEENRELRNMIEQLNKRLNKMEKEIKRIKK